MIYCDVPGSPCLSKTGLMVGESFSIFGSLSLGLPVSCRWLEPRWFAGDLNALAQDNILSRATFPGAPSYGGVRTWVEGTQVHT